MDFVDASVYLRQFFRRPRLVRLGSLTVISGYAIRKLL
jgi:hypothetical protein